MRGQIDAFIYDALPSRVVMGAGKRNQAAVEAGRLGCAPDARALGQMLRQAWKGLPPEPME